MQWPVLPSLDKSLFVTYDFSNEVRNPNFDVKASDF